MIRAYGSDPLGTHRVVPGFGGGCGFFRLAHLLHQAANI